MTRLLLAALALSAASVLHCRQRDTVQDDLRAWATDHGYHFLAGACADPADWRADPLGGYKTCAVIVGQPGKEKTIQLTCIAHEALARGCQRTEP